MNVFVDTLNVILNIFTTAGLVGLGLWAMRRSRTSRQQHVLLVEEIGHRHRTVVRELGRLRMRERDSMELSKIIQHVRRQVALRPDELRQAYAQGFLDAMDGRPLPSSQPAPDGLRVIR